MAEVPRSDVLHLDYPVHPLPRYGWRQPPHAELVRLFDRNREDYCALLAEIIEHGSALATIPPAEDPLQLELPYWRNPWLPPLDALLLYGMIARLRPAKYVEIGSGCSTKFARRAIRDLGLGTSMLSIDPAPRAEIDGLCDAVIRQPLEEVDLALFDELGAGDILFFDGSHRAFTNSDVTVMALEIMPRLPPGVFVHWHDIYLPFDYPPQLSNRFYNEQYMLAAILLAGGRRWQTAFPAFHVAQSPEYRRLTEPFWRSLGLSLAQSIGGSFWLRVEQGESIKGYHGCNFST